MVRIIYDTGSMTTVNAIATHTTSQAIVGKIEKIEVDNTSWTNGSMTLTTSGTTFNGTVLATLVALSGAVTVQQYPMVYATNNATALSGTNWSEMKRIDCFDHLTLATVGCGSTTAGTKARVRIHYFGDD